jgi:polyisoprenoid-binding protein YceI
MLNQPPLKIVSGAITTVGLCLFLVACNPSPASVTSSVPAATAAATNAPTVDAAPTGSLPTAAARPTLTDTSVSSGSLSPTQTAGTSASIQGTSATATAADAVRLVIDSSSSQASYHAREQLVGKTLPSDAVGTSKAVSGNLVLQADGSVLADQSLITVDLTKLQSDESRRDNFIKRDTLQTSSFPMATFVATGVQGLSLPLPTTGQATFQLLGNLTVHGVTRPATWQVTAQFADSTVSGTATTDVKITDFGMTLPKVGPVLSIEDGLTLELAFTAARG